MVLVIYGWKTATEKEKELDDFSNRLNENLEKIPQRMKFKNRNIVFWGLSSKHLNITLKKRSLEKYLRSWYQPLSMLGIMEKSIIALLKKLSLYHPMMQTSSINERLKKYSN